LDDIPDKAWDAYPKFRGENSPLGEKHLDNFTSMCRNLNIIEENMDMQLFFHSFEVEELC